MQIIDDHYHMEHRSIAKRSISPSHHHQRRLNEDNRVAWSKQQKAKSRQKRDFTRLKPKSISKLLNDPKWSSMWYLNVSIIDIYFFCCCTSCSAFLCVCALFVSVLMRLQYMNFVQMLHTIVFAQRRQQKNIILN